MVESIVKVSMQDDNNIDCSYAIVTKSNVSIIIILKDSECAIFDYNAFKMANYEYRYLLLKHYANDSSAYKDFLKLIGKMCKKHENSKYFLNHVQEDNRMIFCDFKKEHMINREEEKIYEKRYIVFKQFVLNNRSCF